MKATIGVTLFAVLNLFLNFLAQVVVASFFGASAELDAFVAASTIPLLLSTVVSGSLTYALMPELVHLQGLLDRDALIRFLSAVLMVVAVIFGSVAVVIAVFSEEVIRFSNPGFTEQTARLGASLLKIQAPIILLVAVNAVLLSHHQAHRRYLRVAVAPVVSPLFMLILVWQMSPYWGVQTLAYSTLLGYLFQSLLLVPSGFSFVTPMKIVQMQELRVLAKKILPLFGGSVIFKTDALVDRFFLSQLGYGPISHLWYSRKLVDASTVVLASGISTTSFTRLSEFAARKEKPQLADKLLEVLQILSFLAVPFTVFLAAYSSEIVQILLERGLFRAADTKQVGDLVIAQVGVLVGGSFGLILASAFYSINDTRTPTFISLITYPFGVALKLWWFSMWGVVGIASAMSVYVVANCVIQVIMLRRQFFQGYTYRLVVFLAKVSSVALISLLGMHSAISIVSLPLIIHVGVAAFGYSVLYLGASWMLNLAPVEMILTNFSRWRQQ